MIKKLLSVVLFLAITLTVSSPAFAKYTRGYRKSNGTYVSGYNSSNSNSSVRDNYSYKGNSNPYTGSVGTNYYRKSKSSEYYQGGF